MSNDPSDVRGEVARRLAELRRREVLAADREAALLETPRPDPRIDAVLAEFRSQVRPSSAEGLFVGERTTQTVVGVDKTDWRGKRKVTTVITGTKNTELAKGWVILRGKGLTRFFGIVLVVTVDGALKLGVRSQDFLPKSPVFGVVYIEGDEQSLPFGNEIVPKFEIGDLRGRSLCESIFSGLGLTRSSLVGSKTEFFPNAYGHNPQTTGDPNELMPVTLAQGCAEALLHYGLVERTI